MSAEHPYIFKEIKHGSPRKLINKAKHQDGIKLKASNKREINNWLLKEPNMTIEAVKERLLETLGIEVSKSTVHRAMRSCGFSYITGRKQDQVENFKK